MNPGASAPPPGGDSAASGAPHVTWHGPLLDVSGYAAVARLIVAALDDDGTCIVARPILEVLPVSAD